VGQINHFTYGWITPALSYALSVLGALLGLTCAARIGRATSPGRRAWWLILAAWAIGGTGIWVMHFMAMLGFGVAGTEIRYDIPLTLASAVLAVAVVAGGLFVANAGRPHPVKIITGGLLAGLGVAGMHYTGMAAVHLNGDIGYDRTLVAASVVIAVLAATVALYFTVAVRRTAAVVGSAFLMGLAVCGMHYTGMLAMSVHLHDPGTADAVGGGASVRALLIPIVLLVIFVVVGLFYAVLAAPTDEDKAGADFLTARMATRDTTSDAARGATPGATRGAARDGAARDGAARDGAARDATPGSRDVAPRNPARRPPEPTAELRDFFDPTRRR
jgi:NO-binding membrane sensor protein with MHYT domain